MSISFDDEVDVEEGAIHAELQECEEIYGIELSTAQRMEILYAGAELPHPRWVRVAFERWYDEEALKA